MNYSDTIVLKYKSNRDMRPVPVRLGDFLKDPAAENRVMAIRECSDKVERDIIKGMNPAVTVSSSSYRKNAPFNTGLIMVDIDYGHNPNIPDMPALVQYLRDVKFIWYCGLSASGRGVFCIIPVATNDFKPHWYALEAYFKALRIVIDPEPKNPGSLRYQSFNDSDTEWYNNDCSLYPGKIAQKVIAPGIAKPVTPDTLVKVRKCLDQISRRKLDICTEGNRGLVIAAFATAFGAGGFEMAWEATRWHETATRENTWARLNSFLVPGYRGNKAGLGSFFMVCKKYGIK